MSPLLSALSAGLILAQGAPADAPSGNALSSFIPLILIVGVFYLLLIRPQQKRARQQKELVAATTVGDQVITLGGIHGTVKMVDDETVLLEIAPNVLITMAKSAIGRRVTDDDILDDDDDDDADDDDEYDDERDDA